MTLPVASEVWRKYAIDGVPASGPNQPDKAQIVSWGTFLESMLGGGAAGLAFVSLFALNSDLSHAANTTAIVYGDATAANNGFYVKAGSAGVGSWSRIGDLPNSIVRLTVTGGTANAIVATAPETPTVPGSKLYLLNPTASNTAATTIIANGAAAAPIKNAFGVDLAAGSLVVGSQVLMAWADDHYQLLISAVVDGTAILAAAVAAQTGAAASASALGNQVHQYDTRALAIAATIPTGVANVRIVRETSASALEWDTYIPGISSGPMAFSEAGGHFWQLDQSGPQPLNKTRLAVTANYTVLNADKGSTIVLTGGAFSVLTFSGTYDTNFFCMITNAETTPIGKGISGTNLSPFTLYPTQGYIVFNDSGTIRILGGIQPYKVNSVQLFCHATLGSDDPLVADGLADGVRAKKTQNASRRQLYQDFNHNGSDPIVTLTGTFSESITFGGQPPNTGVFFWQGSSSGAYIINQVGGLCMEIGDGTVLEISNIYFEASGAAAVGLQLHQDCIIDVLGGCIFGSFGAGNHIGSDGYGWNLNMDANYSVIGGAFTHMALSGGGGMTQGGGLTVSTTGTPAFHNWFTSSGPIIFNMAGGNTFGAIAAGCMQWSIGPGGWLSKSGNTIPGTIAGSPASGSAPTGATGWVT